MVEEFGPAPSLIGPQGLGTTVGYYAGGQFLWFENNVGDEKLVELASSFRPDVILLTPRQLEDEHRSALTERVREMGFVQVDDRRLPPGPEEVVVFAHHRTVTRAKLHAAAATARARQRSFHQ